MVNVTLAVKVRLMTKVVTNFCHDATMSGFAFETFLLVYSSIFIFTFPCPF